MAPEGVAFGVVAGPVVEVLRGCGPVAARVAFSVVAGPLVEVPRADRTPRLHVVAFGVVADALPVDRRVVAHRCSLVRSGQPESLVALCAATRAATVRSGT